MQPKRHETPPLSTPVNSHGNLIYDNAAVGHQLGVDRNDMLAPGKNKRKGIQTSLFI